MKNKLLCQTCEGIELIKKFNHPDDFLECVERISQLIEKDYALISGSLKVKDENGYWVDDCIDIEIRCKTCGAVFHCFVDTYHGRGSFERSIR